MGWRRLSDRFDTTVIALCLGLVAFSIACWPGVELGYLADDYFQIAMIEGTFGEPRWWNLYTFASGRIDEVVSHMERGTLPWWTVPEFRFSMHRPLASILLRLDHLIAPRASLLHHLHGLAWCWACIVCVYVLGRRLFAPRVGLVAAMFFAFDPAMAWMVGWIANRCAVIAAVFAMLAILVGIVHCESKTRRWRWFAVEWVAWLLAFGGGEYAVAFVPYAWALAFALRPGNLRDICVRGLPSVLATAMYVATYFALGHGVYGTTTYVDPLRSPGAFVRVAGDRWARLFGETWASFPCESERLFFGDGFLGLAHWVDPGSVAHALGLQVDRTHLVGHATVGLVLGGAVLLTVFVVLRRRCSPSERRSSLSLALAASATLLPMTAIPASSRSLLAANLGVSLVLALVVSRLTRDALSDVRGRWSRTLAVLICGPLFYLHIVRDLVDARALLLALTDVQASQMQLYSNPQFLELSLEGRRVVVVTTPGLGTGIHGLMTLAVLQPHRSLPDSWHVLSMTRKPHLLRRVDDHTVLLSSVGSGMQIGSDEILFRGPKDGFAVGERVSLAAFEATIEHLHRDGGVDAVSFRFDVPLDDRSILWLELGPRGLVPLKLPASGAGVAIKPPRLPSISRSN